MKKAVIDIGSNSTRLLIANCEDGKVVPLYRKLVTTRLGSFDKISRNMLSSTAVKKTVKAISSFKQIAIDYECEDIYTIATSAVREARNRKNFKDIVKEKTGLDVIILSGKEEANLSFLGAKKGLNISGHVLVIDIGGGSTELSFGKEKVIIAKSYPIGAVKMTKNFFESDPPKKEEVNTANKYLNDVFYSLLKDFPKSDMKDISIIGVGGTLTSLAAMLQQLTEYDSSRVHNYYIKTFQIEKALYNLLSLKCKDIKDIPGISPERADIITAGVFIIYNIIKILNIRGITISESDLMEGLLFNKQ